MTAIRVKHNLNFEPTPGQRIIRREEYADWSVAKDLLQSASDTASRLRKRAGREYRRQIAVGVAAGQAAADREILKRSAEFERIAQQQLADSEKRIGLLLSKAVKKLTGDAPRSARLAQAVGKIIDEISDAERPTITVNPSVRDAILKELEQRGFEMNRLRFVMDKTLDPAMVRVENRFGIIQCDTTAWLDSIAS